MPLAMLCIITSRKFFNIFIQARNFPKIPLRNKFLIRNFQITRKSERFPQKSTIDFGRKEYFRIFAASKLKNYGTSKELQKQRRGDRRFSKGIRQKERVVGTVRKRTDEYAIATKTDSRIVLTQKSSLSYESIKSDTTESPKSIRGME